MIIDDFLFSFIFGLNFLIRGVNSANIQPNDCKDGIKSRIKLVVDTRNSKFSEVVFGFDKKANFQNSQLYRFSSQNRNTKNLKFSETNSDKCSSKSHSNEPLTFSSDIPDQRAPLLIPKVFHSIWMDFGKGSQIPEPYIENRKKLMDLHPGWKLREWNEQQIMNLIKKKYPFFLDTWLSYDKPIKKHDSSRAVILHAFGGVYIDHDFYPLRNIEPLLKSYEFVAGNEKESWFEPSNGFLASAKRHPLMLRYIQPMNYKHLAKQIVLIATGPFRLRNVINKYVKEHGKNGLKVYEISFFYSHSKELPNKSGLSDEDLRKAHPNCFMIHGYDFTWKYQ